MITLRNVSRWYGQVIGLNDVSCEISPGITALLGQNGAGKSTMMRLITGQLKPTTGDISVFGERPFAKPSIYKRIGYCPEIDNFYEYMTGRQFVNFLGRLSGYDEREARERTQRVLELVGMADRADKKIAGFSKGMRQRIKLAQAMIHDPDIILLDEPLNGLDPVGRRDYMDMLGSLAERGKAILVSSHILYEVEQLTRSILLLHRGRLLATGDLRVIRSLIDKHPHRIKIETTDPRRVAATLLTLPYVISMQFEPAGGALELECGQPDEFYSTLPRMCQEHHLPITSMSSPDNNLEAVFSYLVGN